METTGKGARVVPFDPSIRTRLGGQAGGVQPARSQPRSAATARAVRVRALKEALLALRLVLESGPENCPRE